MINLIGELEKQLQQQIEEFTIYLTVEWEFEMTPYRNLHGNSDVLCYETTEDSIHVVFKSGVYRNYLFDVDHPGKAVVEEMKRLAAQGFGLGRYIDATAKHDFVRKW